MNFDEVVFDEDLTETNENYIRMTRRVKAIAFKGRSYVFEYRLGQKTSFFLGGQKDVIASLLY
jgi:hypothetical protein